ncbi:MAG: YraN family protein [Gammaproteobacteria bacterium]|nr:YraN family protein [Gammaproteobacteria bacterium]
MTVHCTGAQAEQMALTYLEQQGLSVIDQNYHSRRAEIDLIMVDKDTLVFIEVRFRKSEKYGSALESVNYQKQTRIIRTATHTFRKIPPNPQGIDLMSS